MTLSSKDANEQIQEEFKKAGLECPVDTETLITELTIKIEKLGKKEKFHDMMCDQTKVTIDRILENNEEKLGPYAEKICEILENTAPTPKAKAALQATLASTKVQYMQNDKVEKLESTLSLVEKTITDLVKNDPFKKVIGDVNAGKFTDISIKMNDRLIALAKPNLNYTKAEIQSKRAEILVEGIGKMNEFLQNAEKEAGKGKFGKVMKVLKSALKVIGTLGLNKSAKLELAAATFLMDEKNVAKIKGVVQEVSRDLKKSVAFINEKKNEKGMGR